MKAKPVQENFCALYYPFSRCFNITALKRALLYFDKLYFLDPYNLDQRENAVRTSHYYDGVRLADKQRFSEMIDSVYRPLESAGWIEGVDVFPLIKKYDAQLTANTHEDLADPDFCSYSFGDIDINKEHVCWQVIKERMPPTLIQNLKEVSWGEFRTAVGGSAATYARFKDTDNARFVSFQEEYYQGLRKPESRTGFPRIRISVDSCPMGTEDNDISDAKAKAECTGYVLPYACGASICINQALLYAAMNGLSLFTDSITQHYLLRRKSQIAIHKTGNADFIQKSVSLVQRIKETDVICSLLDDLMTPFVGDRIGLNEVIRFRRKNESRLKELRRYMLEMRNLSAQPWDQDYLLKVREVVDQIHAKIGKLRTEFQTIYKDLLRDTFQALAGAALGLAFTPLNMTAGAVLAVLASKVPLDSLWAGWKHEAELRRSDVSYLLFDSFRAQYGLHRWGERLPWERFPLC